MILWILEIKKKFFLLKREKREKDHAFWYLMINVFEAAKKPNTKIQSNKTCFILFAPQQPSRKKNKVNFELKL